MDKQAARGIPFFDELCSLAACKELNGVINESAMFKRRDEVEPREEDEDPEEDDEVGEITSST